MAQAQTELSRKNNSHSKMLKYPPSKNQRTTGSLPVLKLRNTLKFDLNLTIITPQMSAIRRKVTKD